MIETARLILRAWREEDAYPLLLMEQDQRVMEFLGPLGDAAEARRIVSGQTLNQTLFGHCFWAVERREDGAFLGFCGLNPGAKDTPLAGGLEIGWRLAHHAWGQGYAHEAAMASIAWGWANTDQAEILAMTVAANTRSWRLMERLGMVRDPAGDFDHPALVEDDPLRPHILYRIARPISRPATP